MRTQNTGNRFAGSGWRLWGAVVAGTVLLAGVGAADAKLTTPECLAKKQKNWTNLRKCQGTEAAKGLLGKPTDLAKCQTKFDDTLTKIAAQASAAAIACRYADNGNGTVTDYDTGLQWEKKAPGECSNALIACVTDSECPGGSCVAGPHYVNTFYNWNDAGTLVNGTSTDGSAVTGDYVGFAGHSDWRLPTIVELIGILDLSDPNCGSVGNPCIDGIFGLTADLYYSATSDAAALNRPWVVSFGYRGGSISAHLFRGYKDIPTSENLVRAVRSAL